MATATGLEPDEINKVLQLLNMSSATFAAITGAFTQSFTPERHSGVVALLRVLLDSPFGLSDNVTAIPQTLIAYHLLRQAQLTASQGMRRNPIVNFVRATQFHELQRLEGLLREDAKAAESHKYKIGSGADKGTGNASKKQTAKEAGEIDIGRCRLLMKSLLFRHVLNRPDAESVSELLAIPRATLETEAESWAAQAPLKQSIVEALGELKAAAEVEAAGSIGGGVSRAALFPREDHDGAGLLPAMQTMRPPWARPAPTTLPASTAELRFLVSSSISSSLLVDATGYTPEWKTATTLLATARTQQLTAAQHQQLVNAATKCVGHINLTVAAFLDVSEHNPQTAAGLLPTAASPELYVDALIALPNAAGCMRSEVLLAAAGILQPHQLTAYIKQFASHIRQSPKAHQADLISNFAVTLHQLAKKLPLAKADNDLVSQLFVEHASHPDVSSLWPAGKA